MKKELKQKYFLHFSNSFSSPLYISLKKHIEEGRKHIEKGEKKTFSTLFLSLITTHIDTSHFYLYWKNKHKNIRK